MKRIDVSEQGLYLTFYVSDEGRVALVHCGASRYAGAAPKEETFRFLSPVELATAETGFRCHHGAKKLCGALSDGLRFQSIDDRKIDGVREIALCLVSCDAEVVCRYRIHTFEGADRVKAPPVCRCETAVTAKRPFTLEYVSSFRYAGLFPPFDGGSYERLRLWMPHNTWHGEGQWLPYALEELGLNACHAGGVHIKRIVYGNTGSWSTKEYLPAGALTDGSEWLMWQTEANGSWSTEIGQASMMPYLALSGPTFAENAWHRAMGTGETFVSVSAALTAGGDVNSCIAGLTQYRRAQAVCYRADSRLSPQYNGYMHCNWDLPTTEGVLAQMDACAALGVEHFVIDAGWFSQGEFWKTLGDWTHPNEPFTGTSLAGLLDRCRGLGMKPGLWLELEDIGVDCPILPDVDPLLMRRRGIRVTDNDRCFFDFSLPETRAYMDRIVDTLVERYGVQYVKLDYNCDCGIGCDTDAGGWGDGLLKHDRAFLRWIADWHARCPDLVIEGCASGGMRLDPATLAAFALGNTSDQVCYERTPYIACNLSAWMVPERMGVWAYPQPEEDGEKININLVNAMLFRMQLSGPIHTISRRQMQQIEQGLAYYRSLSEFKKRAVPYLPQGFCRFFDRSVTFGLRDRHTLLLAVYALGGQQEQRIDLPDLCPSSVRVAFPIGADCTAKLVGDSVEVRFAAAESAAILEIALA